MAAPLVLPAARHAYVVRHDATEALRLHHLELPEGASPAAPAVLLVHGVTGHAGAWAGVAPLLAPQLRPVAVDLRGHGASQWSPTGDYATTTHADDLLAHVDALGLERVHLVGSSWGALVCLAFARRHPERTDRLVLVDIEPSFSQGVTEVAPRPRSFATSDDVVAYERSRNPNAPDDVLRAVAGASVRPGPGGLEPWFDPLFFERWPFRTDDWWDALPAVAAPTLVVHAGQSFVRREITEQMAALLPDGRHVEIADSTHVVPVDAPHALVRVLHAFLAAHP